jgi:hypothetical protein
MLADLPPDLPPVPAEVLTVTVPDVDVCVEADEHGLDAVLDVDLDEGDQ